MTGSCRSLMPEPKARGGKRVFKGTTVLKVVDGKMVEEIRLDDGVTALTQLGLIMHPAMPS